jgi:D-cysteine desulfhydrase
MALILPPRVPLAQTPTPVEHLADLGRDLGLDLYVKRDDLTGLELSGNKVRKLEFLLAEAVACKADRVITCGGVQSNHCRTTALAARRLGLGVELFLEGLDGAAPEGNLLLDRLTEATLHHLDRDGYAARDRLMAERGEELASRGLTAYIIPEGGSNALGALGYVRAMEEIVAEERRLGQAFDALVCAAGSGGTLAGLLAGAAVHGFAGRIIGIAVVPGIDELAERTEVILGELSRERLGGTPAELPPGALVGGHAGPGYGLASDEDLRRLRDVAVLTGLILDPVYTGKAFAGLLALVREGPLRGSRTLFLHTGGLFGLFPFGERLAGLAP